MIRNARSTAVLVGFFLVLSSQAYARPFALTIAKTVCPAVKGEQIELKMVLESEEGPGEADSRGSEWVRRITLGFETGKTEVGFEPFWSMEDKVDEITSPMPTVDGALACFRHGAGRSLYAASLIFKSDWQQDWTEAWVVSLQLPVEGYRLREDWKEYVPRLPLPRGAIVTRASLAYMDHNSLVGILGARGRGPTPYLLYWNLHRKHIWLYSGGSVRKLGAKADEARKEEAPERLHPGPEWQGCESILDCVAEKDLCLNLVPIRRDRVEEFRSWARDSVLECGPRPRWRPDELPSLLCEKSLCTIRWVDKEQSGDGTLE